MPYDPSKVRGNFGPGGFSDQYDNGKMRSMDRDQHPGGVTGVPFEDDVDLDDMRYSAEKSETYNIDRDGPNEPDRDVDLSVTGTNWNRGIGTVPSYVGRGPQGWKFSDERLKERVCEVLLHSHDVDPSNLDVIVQDQVVYLKGSIHSKGMRRVAEDLVGSIPGVIDVFSELTIRS